VTSGVGAYAAFVYALAGDLIAQEHLQLMRQSCVVAFIASKLPQIVTNYAVMFFGCLDLFLTVNYLGGRNGSVIVNYARTSGAWKYS
jgi:hypothetical protein